MIPFRDQDALHKSVILEPEKVLPCTIGRYLRPHLLKTTDPVVLLEQLPEIAFQVRHALEIVFLVFVYPSLDLRSPVGSYTLAIEPRLKTIPCQMLDVVPLDITATVQA